MKKMSLWRGMSALACALVAVACSTGVRYDISGTWKDGAGNRIYLNRIVEGDSLVAVDSATVADDFTFAMRGSVEDIQKMALTYADDHKREIMVDGEPIVLTLERKMVGSGGKEREILSVSCEGGVEQTVLEKGKDLQTTLALMGLGKMMALGKVDANDQEAVDSVMHMVHVLDSALQAAVVNYLDSTRNNYASTYFFEAYLMDNYTYDEVQDFYTKLTDRVKASAPGVALKRKIEEMGMVSVGGVAPNFKAKTPEGTELALYDLRGHVVLLDFWASWCGPCMAEMPNVKAIYEKYHGKGLEILGVSLDSDREKWVAAIEKNGLAWHHVSSLSQFDCPIAKRFRVTGIPRMYILDENGKIIAQDLRGEALAKKMDELFAGK